MHKYTDEILSMSHDLFSVSDLEGKLLFANAAYESILGFDRQELLGKSFFDLIQPEDLENAFKKFSALKENGTLRDTEVRMVHKNGSIRDILWNARISAETGRTVAVGRDVTQDRENQRQKEKAINKFEHLVSQTPGMIYQFILRPDGATYFHYVSPKAFEIYEMTEEDFIQDPAIMVKMADPNDEDGLRKAIEKSAKEMSTFEWTGRIYTKTGKLKWIKAHSQPRVFEQGGIIWDGVVLDVSNEVQMRENLKKERAKALQAAKLATLGEMAAGIAHEVNNPLAVIKGQAELLQRGEDDKAITEARFEKISRSIDRIVKIINGLRKFARSTEEKAREAHCIDDIIKETVSLVGGRLEKCGIQLMLELQCPEKFFCDEIEMEQVLVNLINNSADAIKDQKNSWIRVRTEASGSHIVISIEDSGSGVPKEIQSKIFNPFFTTKKVGEGTGIGMSIVKGIVEDHQGSIELKTDSTNTCFELRFSRTNRSA